VHVEATNDFKFGMRDEAPVEANEVEGSLIVMENVVVHDLQAIESLFTSMHVEVSNAFALADASEIEHNCAKAVGITHGYCRVSSLTIRCLYLI
jgi:hypothetical protein